MPTMRRGTLALTVLALLQYKPLHPYGIQRLIKEWGKDQVVNVSQRASLYRIIDQLQAAGLIKVRETERDQAYPERTIYEITADGRRTARTWLLDMLSVPDRSFPEFPAALSHLLMLSGEQIAESLDRRHAALTAMLEHYDAVLAYQNEQGHPRITALETEYLRAVTAAEADWVRSVADDLRTGRLSWSAEELTAMADAQETGS
jgi:DNA-binding PadR family transcriptional regulator